MGKYIDQTGSAHLMSLIKGAITESSGLPSGGTAGQYLMKASSAEGDVSWADMSIPTHYHTSLGNGNVDVITVNTETKSVQEGYNTTASSSSSHAEGISTTANNRTSHAEGWGTIASGDLGSHAEGYNTVASGRSSHAQNVGTIASRSDQTALGKYNIEDPESNGIYAAIIGNGTSDSDRSNAIAVRWNGIIDEGTPAVPGSIIPVGGIIDYAGTSVPNGYLECDGSAVSRTAYPLLFAAIGTTWGAGNGSTTFNLPNLNGRVTIGKGSRTVGDTSVGSESQSYTPSGSVNNHTLTENEIPSHDHAQVAHTHSVSGGKVTDHNGSSGGMSANESHYHKGYFLKDAASGTAKNLATVNGASGRVEGTGKFTQSASLAHTHTINHGHGFTQPTVNGGATTTGKRGGGQAHNHGFTGTAATISHMQPSAVVRKIIRAA